MRMDDAHDHLAVSGLDPDCDVGVVLMLWVDRLDVVGVAETPSEPASRDVTMRASACTWQKGLSPELEAPDAKVGDRRRADKDERPQRHKPLVGLGEVNCGVPPPALTEDVVAGVAEEL